MKYLLLTIGLFIILTVSIALKMPDTAHNHTSKKEKKYLPVCLSVNDYQVNDFYLYCKIYLKTKGIKVISKQDAKDLSDQEARSSAELFFKSNPPGVSPDMENYKRSMASNMQYVVNQLSVNIKFDSITNRVDSFKVGNFPLPINLGNPYKRKWISFDLSKIDMLPLTDFVAAVSDSIIKANILLKEK
jgi:hypothetical protein